MRNRRPALAAIAGAASVSLALTACGQSGAARPERGGTVGIAMPTKASERWIADGNNVVKDLKGMGYKTRLVYGDDDPERQVEQIQDLVKRGVDVLVVAAIDNRSLGKVLQQAADAEIPVISYDRLILGTENVDYYASFDNEQVGRPRPVASSTNSAWRTARAPSTSNCSPAPRTTTTPSTSSTVRCSYCSRTWTRSSWSSGPARPD